MLKIKMSFFFGQGPASFWLKQRNLGTMSSPCGVNALVCIGANSKTCVSPPCTLCVHLKGANEYIGCLEQWGRRTDRCLPTGPLITLLSGAKTAFQCKIGMLGRRKAFNKPTPPSGGRKKCAKSAWPPRLFYFKAVQNQNLTLPLQNNRIKIVQRPKDYTLPRSKEFGLRQSAFRPL